MSTITTTSKGLVPALLSYFRPDEDKTFAIQFDENRVVIDVLPESGAKAGNSELVSSFQEDTPEERRESMRAWLHSIAVPAGLSDFDVSSESIYSPDE